MRSLVSTRTLRGIEDVFTFRGDYNEVQITLVPQLFPLVQNNVNGFGAVPGSLGLKDYNPLFEVQMPFYSGDLRKLFSWYCVYMWEETRDVFWLNRMLNTFVGQSIVFSRGIAHGVFEMSFAVPQQSEFTMHVRDVFAAHAMPVEYASMSVEVRLYKNDSININAVELKQFGKLFLGRSGDIMGTAKRAYLIVSDFYNDTNNMFVKGNTGFVSVDGLGYYHDNLLSLMFDDWDNLSLPGASDDDSLHCLSLGSLLKELTYNGFESQGHNIMFELYGLI